MLFSQSLFLAKQADSEYETQYISHTITQVSKPKLRFPSLPVQPSLPNLLLQVSFPKVLAAMEIQKSQIESEPKQSSPKPTSTVTTSCGRKKSDDASFVTNLRDRFHDFINTPMADHKTCLKTTIHKMMAVFPKINSSPKGGESSIPSQASVEN